MGLIPAVLGAIGKPFQLTYKVSRLALRLNESRKVWGIADHLASFALDIKGKARISLAWFIIKLVHSRVRCQQLAGKTYAWIEQHRSGATDKVLEADLDSWLSATPADCPTDPLVKAGLLFLRDCIARRQEMDMFVERRFSQPDGQLDVRAALTDFFSTTTAFRLADALSRPANEPVALQNLLNNVYEDLRLALRRDLTDLFIL